jgi:peptidoglycan/LPS O-acetylase OafA/YrhL
MIGNRDKALDGVRGIAALCVVLSHVAAMTWNPFSDGATGGTMVERLFWHLGAPAVDVFFVLSGYVVTQAIVARRPGYADFVFGRMVRLYPIAWIAVLAGLVLRSAGLVPPTGASAALHSLTETLTTSDVSGFATMLAPIPVANKVNPPLWTLVVEMQAALIMPLLAWAASKKPQALAVGWAFLAAVIVPALSWYYPYFFTGFGLGASLVFLEKRIPRAPRPRAVLAFFVAALLCRHYLNSEEPSLRIPCALAAAGMILAIRQGAGRAFLESRPCLWLGRMSYPLYAVHWPIMAAACMTLGWYVGVTAAALASVPVAMAAAMLLERWVERPAIALSRLMRRG